MNMKTLPKVAIITPGSFAIPDPRSSSVETVVNKISTILQNDINYSIYGRKTKKHPLYEVIEKIKYIRFPFYSSKSYITKVITALKNEDYDILQVENRPKFVKTLRTAFPDATIFLSLHSTTFISSSVITNVELINCFQAANKIIVNSYFLKKLLVKKTKCNPKKIYVNHLGVDTDQFQTKWSHPQQQFTNQLKKEHNVQDKNILLYIGRLRKIKGIHHILKAMPEIVRRNPNTMLYIVGSAYYGSDKRTKYVNYLYKLANEVEEHVCFIPYVPHDQINKWYQIADIMLVPSANKEAFGLVNVEAMASGIPVIATKSGGMPEIIDDGVTGFLIDRNNIHQDLIHITSELFSNPSIIRDMGEASVQHVLEHFTWEHTANRFLQLYQTTIKEGFQK